MITGKKVFAGLKLAHGAETAGGAVAVWTIPPDLPYFDGHFPGNPIFPAVGIVDATLFLLKQAVQADVYVSHFPVAKFLSPIQPGQTVRIELSPLKENEWQAEWQDGSSRKSLATLRFQW